MKFGETFKFSNGQEKSNSNGETERLNIKKILENRNLRKKLTEDTKEWLNLNV